MMAEQVQNNSQNALNEITLEVAEPEDILLQINEFRKNGRYSMGVTDNISGAALGRSEAFPCTSHHHQRPTGKTLLQFSISQTVPQTFL